MNIPVNDYEEVTIENGLQGVKRYDLICARYTKNADTSIESAELVVMKGTSSANPSDPACVEGNILEGALIDDFPLYRVRLDGLNIVGVDCLFEVIPSLEMIKNQIFGIDGIPVGKLPDGKTVYMAYGSFDIGLSASSSYIDTTFPHGISNISKIYSFIANIVSVSGALDYPLPYINENGAIDTFVKTVNKNNVVISNRTSWSKGSYNLNFIMYYSKE
jgi:hypothetical protein